MIIALILFSLGMFGIYFWWATDRLIKYEHDHHHEEWIYDGKPRGMFFRPKGSSYLAYNLILIRWLKSEPYWVRRDDRAAKLYSEFIVLNKIAIIVTISSIISVIWLANA